MSGLKITKEQDDRMSESRMLLLNMMYKSIPYEDLSIVGFTYGERYAGMKDCVNSLLNAGINEQVTLSQQGCYHAARMIIELVWSSNKLFLQSTREAMLVAYGGYVEQEGKKSDQWRDETLETLYRHLDHEIDEVRRSKSKTVRLHNAMDACSLFAMLAVRYMGD